MATAAERKAIPPAPKEEEIAFEVTPLGSELVKQLSQKDFAYMQLISVAIGKDGMTLDEALILNNINADHFKSLMEKAPIIKQVIRLKELEYKRSLMKTLSHRARSGDDDAALTLLEWRYPGEFGKGKKASDDDSDDVLKEAIDYIQNSGDATPIIQRTNVLAPRPTIPVAPEAAGGVSTAIKRLQSFLS